MTTLSPTAIGWYIFRGIRHSTRPGTIQRFCEPVRIVTLSYPREDVLAVAHAGSATLYELARYEGEFEIIELERIAT